jgi:hypothetical protein
MTRIRRWVKMKYANSASINVLFDSGSVTIDA